MGDMSDAQGAFLLVIDRLPLRRIQIVRFLEDWSLKHGLRIIDCDTADVFGNECVHDVALLVLSIGSDGLTDPLLSRLLRFMRAVCPDTPIAVLSDEATECNVAFAIGMDAAALIPASLEADVVLATLEFVWNGGTYFPVGILRKRLVEPEKGSAANTASPVPDRASPEMADPMHGDPTPDEGAGGSQRGDEGCWQSDQTPPPPDPELFQDLTRRQLEVLECLREGLANKQIARSLDMSEATVKVHVRKLMKRLGASNRTQAAVMAMQRLQESDRPHSAIDLLRELGNLRQAQRDRRVN